jgi:hypothetical protein
MAYDNAKAESFFAAVKREEISQQPGVARPRRRQCSRSHFCSARSGSMELVSNTIKDASHLDFLSSLDVIVDAQFVIQETPVIMTTNSLSVTLCRSVSLSSSDGGAISLDVKTFTLLRNRPGLHSVGEFHMVVSSFVEAERLYSPLCLQISREGAIAFCTEGSAHVCGCLSEGLKKRSDQLPPQCFDASRYGKACTP